MKEHLGKQPRRRDKGQGLREALAHSQQHRVFTDSSLLFLRGNSWKLVPSSATRRFLVKLKINPRTMKWKPDSSTQEQTKAAPSFSLCTNRGR